MSRNVDGSLVLLLADLKRNCRECRGGRIALKLAEKKIDDLFESAEDVKTRPAAYMNAAGATGTLGQQMFAHMRLDDGWLKVRFSQNPCDIYQNVISTDPEIQASSNGSGSSTRA